MELIENEQNDNFKTRFSFLYLMEWGKKRRNEGDLISFSNISADYECSLQDQLHLESENGIENENEKYLLLANQQCSKMNNPFHNECYFE